MVEFTVNAAYSQGQGCKSPLVALVVGIRWLYNQWSVKPGVAYLSTHQDHAFRVDMNLQRRVHGGVEPKECEAG